MPPIKPDGSYVARDSGRKMRACHSVDTRMMQDFSAKLSARYG